MELIKIFNGNEVRFIKDKNEKFWFFCETSSDDNGL